MRQRYGPRYGQQAYCKLHGSYPMNFTYRGGSFGNACPKCYPNWQKQWKEWRDRMLDDRNSKDEAPHE